MNDKNDLLRTLPKVDELLNHPTIIDKTAHISRIFVVNATRRVIQQKRQVLLAESLPDANQIDIAVLIEQIIDLAEVDYHMHLKPVVNATGVVLHTNLGRAPLSQTIKDVVWQVAEGYSTLEYDILSGKRGSRYSHVEMLITQITGAESALVVNNNAAAVMLILNTLANHREVIVSRGELVEIGGSFRVPEIMAQSGGVLIEVGTTNKTHNTDYIQAINSEKTGALLKVHTSNYKILGFTEEVSLSEMVKIGNQYNVPVVHDLGCGLLFDFSKYGIADEATVFDSVKAGADIICFSGDKLLGGPQSGIIVGKKKYINAMKKNPLTRAFRIDKLTLAALEATLRIYCDEARIVEEIPIIKMLTMSQEILMKKANILLTKLNSLAVCCEIALEAGTSQVGGGSMPLVALPTTLIKVKPFNIKVSTLEQTLRKLKKPIIVRVFNDCLYLDVRTIKDEDFDYIVEQLKKVIKSR